MTAPTVPLPRRRARLGRYALWQLGDFGFNVAIVTILLFGLLGALFVMNIHVREQMMAMASRRFQPPTDWKLTMFTELLSMFAFVAPIIAMSGVISSDRASGYTRFLFSKPVSPLAFYAQSALIRVVGFVVIACLLLGLWSMFEPPALSWKFVVDVTGYAVSIGGIIFCMSSLTKYDGLLAVVFMLLVMLIRGRWEATTGILHDITYLLPPIGRLSDLNAWMLGLDPQTGDAGTVAFPAKWFWWNVGYGIALAAIGLAILRKRSLTKA